MDCSLLKEYAVTDRSWLNGRSLESVVEEVLKGGASILQLREKQLSRDEFVAEGRVLKELCGRYKVPLLINDDVSVARELGVGAHIGQGDMSIQEARRMLGPDAIIGVSCQTVAQAIEAEAAGADYLGVGAVFPTSTKLDADYVDANELYAICGAVDIGVVAIGGINSQNLWRLAGSGIDGVAVVSALFGAREPGKAAAELDHAIDEMLSVPVSARAGAIVDLDGTTLDSMPYWDTLGVDYLKDRGVNVHEEILNILNSMELETAAHYLKCKYGLVGSEQEICQDLLDRIRFVYEDQAPLFPGVREKLKSMHESGIRLALFSAAESSSIVAALKRNGVYQFFDCCVSTLDIGMEKSNPAAYYHVLGRLGTSLAHTTIYEDAQYAVEGARKTRMRVVQVSSDRGLGEI